MEREKEIKSANIDQTAKVEHYNMISTRYKLKWAKHVNDEPCNM